LAAAVKHLVQGQPMELQAVLMAGAVVAVQGLAAVRRVQTQVALALLA
jgi:hypothetical protein